MGVKGNGNEGILKEPAKYIKGVGEARAALLKKLGISTVEDVIYHFPRTYEDRSSLKKIAFLEDGEPASFIGEIDSTVRENRVRKGLVISKVRIADDTGSIIGTWFNRPYLKNTLKVGDRYVFYGKIKRGYGQVAEVLNPVYEKLESSETKHTCRIVPIYPSTGNLSQNMIRNIIFNALEKTREKIDEYLPVYIRKRYGLIGINQAVQSIHFPSCMDDFIQARKRLVFEELFLMQLSLLRLKNSYKSEKGGIRFEKPGDVDRLVESLDFKLTSAQLRVWDEIRADMESDKPMNRLVQGDVGSGKTVVALLAVLKAVGNGYQAAVMAPTEILANQHFRLFQKLTEPFGVTVALLSSSCGTADKKRILKDLKSGKIDVIVGTHAIIEDNVEFDRLGLVVTDEQHRFGVRQRAALNRKGANPDVLVMTATPIPRTLALILYGDLDISIIDEMPPGRKRVDTFVLEESMRERINAFIRKQVNEGRQVYIVCPLVEDSDEIEAKSVMEHAMELSQKVFGDLKVGLLHGKMRSSEKDSVMKGFVSGEISVLVSTTVIEVGIDVPNATLMVVENAERFGLAQLHQLRGRVGRGEHQSYCILFNSNPNPVNSERLGVLQKTNDGFVIAEKDLQMRGPGEFFGTRQHGLPDMRIANLYRDIDILKQAQEATGEVLKRDPHLSSREHDLLKKKMGELFEQKIDRATLN